MDPTRLLAELEAILGADHVLVDAALRAGFETDWTGRFHGTALAVVRPADTAEVAAVLRACRAAGVGVVPQGGNTGLVGGGVPRDGSVLLSTVRLAALGGVDALAGEVVAGAGVTLARLAAHARESGLELAVDFGARDAATIGGMIATNAGGVHVFRAGPMRDQVVGIEAVLADGSVVSRLDRPRKDNTGYSLPALLAGSEGTLAVITAARLRLSPIPARRAVALVALPDVDAAVRVAAELRRAVPELRAAELMLAEGLALVQRNTGAPRPFATDPAVCLLVEAAGGPGLVEAAGGPGPVEAAGGPGPSDALADALAAIDGVVDAVIADDTAARDRLWQLREAHPDAIGHEGVPHKLDVSLPVGRIGEFAARVADRVTSVAPGTRTILFGHVLDGNLHVNVLGADPTDDAVDDAVLRLVIELGGSISAEHGIGVAKTRWLALDRSPAELSAMRAIKRALDPDGILNPGVLLPPAAG